MSVKSDCSESFVRRAPRRNRADNSGKGRRRFSRQDERGLEQGAGGNCNRCSASRRSSCASLNPQHVEPVGEGILIRLPLARLPTDAPCQNHVAYAIAFDADRVSCGVPGGDLQDSRAILLTPLSARSASNRLAWRYPSGDGACGYQQPFTFSSTRHADLRWPPRVVSVLIALLHSLRCVALLGASPHLENHRPSPQ